MRTRPRLLPAIVALLVLAAVGAIAFSGASGAAAAGTALGYCQVPVSYAGESSALAFAGQDLVYANPDSASLYRFRPWEPCPQPGAGVPLQGQANTYALAYDGGRQVLWALAVNGGASSVYTVDLGGGQPTPRFDISGGTFQGLAYDASDDTLWASAEFLHIVRHYSTTGALLDNCVLPFTPYGLLVAGNRIYASGNFAIHVVDRSTCAGGAIAPEIESWSTNAFEGDLECDPVTFAGQEVFWSKERVGNAVGAWTADPGTCPPGSGYTVPPTATPVPATNTPLPTATNTPYVAPTHTPVSQNEDEEGIAPPPVSAPGAPLAADEQQTGLSGPFVRLPNTGQADTGRGNSTQQVLVILVVIAAAAATAGWALHRRRS